MHVRVMTYNVRHCRTFWGTVRPERIAEIIKTHKVDIAALQELDIDRRRTGFINQPQIIADCLGMNYLFQPTYRNEKSQYGTAVFSRFPLTSEDKERAQKKIRSFEHLRPAIHRVYVNLDGERKIEIINAHLHWRRGPRKKDAQIILEEGWLPSINAHHPSVFLGDFNAGSRSAVYKNLERQFPSAHPTQKKPLRTWLSFLPVRSLDHIWVTGPVKVDKIFSPAAGARTLSDHLPVIADLVV